MDDTTKRQKLICPRCKSKRMRHRLDGSRWCARCGQRMTGDGRLLPSADRRDNSQPPPNQLILL